MRKLTWIAASAALALGACASHPKPDKDANEPQPPSVLLSSDAMLFVSFDTDNDGRMTAAELDAGAAREWTRADRNGDGSLTPVEFADWSAVALGGQQLPPYRLNFDRNVDNVITRAEFIEELHARAADYDANHDGVVTRAEMLRPMPHARVQPGMMQRPGGPLPGAGGEGGPGGRPPL